MTESRVRAPNVMKNVGYVCPRCGTRLMRDYDDLSCYVCGYHTAHGEEPAQAGRVTVRKAA